MASFFPFFVEEALISEFLSPEILTHVDPPGDGVLADYSSWYSRLSNSISSAAVDVIACQPGGGPVSSSAGVTQIGLAMWSSSDHKIMV